MSRELLKLAFEAIERGVKDGYWNKDTVDVSTRIQKYLAEQAAQPQQEPVAWISEIRCVGPEYGKKRYEALPVQSLQPGFYAHTPLYTSPPPHRKPLTDEQIGQILDDPNIAEAHQGHWRVLPFAYARAIEAAHGIKGDA